MEIQPPSKPRRASPIAPPNFHREMLRHLDVLEHGDHRDFQLRTAASASAFAVASIAAQLEAVVLELRQLRGMVGKLLEVRS